MKLELGREEILDFFVFDAPFQYFVSGSVVGDYFDDRDYREENYSDY